MLPDPYLLQIPAVTHFDNGSQAAGTMFGANTAAYVPFYLPESATVYALHCFITGTTGDYDIGLYNSAFSRLASTGSVAVSAAGRKTLSISDMRLTGGRLYYAALCLSSNINIIRYLGGGAAIYNILAGVLAQTSAFPLPATANPVDPGATVYPVFALGVR